MNNDSSSFWKNFSLRILNASTDANGVPVNGSLYFALVFETGQSKGTGPNAVAEPGITGLTFLGSSYSARGREVSRTQK